MQSGAGYLSSSIDTERRKQVAHRKPHHGRLFRFSMHK